MDETNNPKLVSKSDLQHQYHDDEIDLVDIVKIVWSQRWFIAGLTLLIVALATVYVFFKAPLYEVTAQISPGISDFDKNGNAIRKLSPNDVVAWFSEIGFAAAIEGDQLEVVPKIKAKVISKSNNVKISYYSRDPKKGTNMLSLILKNLNDGRADYFNRELIVGRATIEQRIREIEQKNKSLILEQSILQKVDKIRLTSQIDSLQDKIKILTKNIDILKMNRISSERSLAYSITSLQRITKNTEELQALSKQMITESADDLVVFMYSNSIQQNLSYANNIQNQILDLNRQINDYMEKENGLLEEVDQLKNQINNYLLERDQLLSLKKEELDLQLENGNIEIDTLETKLNNLSIIDIIKAPNSSLKPIKPNKIKIITLSIVVGLLLSILASFARSFWLHNKIKILNNS
jgi:LPS O-antigen subunit length determinant protein (WzzB/FepE family)